MSVYAIIMLVLTAMSAGIVMVKHGQPRENYNFWMWLFSAAIQIGLMYAGGFFNKVV